MINYRSKTQTRTYFSFIVMILIPVGLVYMGMNIDGVLIYSLVVILLILIWHRHCYIVTVKSRTVKISYLNIFKNNISFSIDQIQSIEYEKGSRFLNPVGNNYLNDSITFHLTDGREAIIKPERYSNHNDLLEIIENLKEQTLHNNRVK